MVVLHRSSFIEWQPTPVVALASSGDGSLTVAARENGDLELYETATSHCFQVRRWAQGRASLPNSAARRACTRGSPGCRRRSTALIAPPARPTRLQRVPGTKDAATTCVALVDEAGGSSCRLFTAGLDGAITEIDLEHRRAAAATDSYGGAVWQLAPEPAAAAAAEAASPQHEAGDDAAGAASAAPAAAGGESSSDDDADDAAPAAASPRLAAACDDGCVRLFTVDPGVPGASYAKSLPRVEGRCLAVAWHPSGR